MVVAVNGKQVMAADELTAAIASLRPGEKATLKVQRGGSILPVFGTLAVHGYSAASANLDEGVRQGTGAPSDSAIARPDRSPSS